MTKLIAFATIAAAALAATPFHVTFVSAQSVHERAGIVLPNTTPPDPTKTFLCSKPGLKAVYACNAAEYKTNPGYRTNATTTTTTSAAERKKQKRIKQEMEAEARAYKKIQEERKRSAPTTEHCIMKSGALVCKPV